MRPSSLNPGQRAGIPVCHASFASVTEDRERVWDAGRLHAARLVCRMNHLRHLAPDREARLTRPRPCSAGGPRGSGWSGPYPLSRDNPKRLEETTLSPTLRYADAACWLISPEVSNELQ